MGGGQVKLVDTSSWIEYLRNAESDAGNRVEELVLTGDAGWCDVTAVELWHGVRGAREKQDLAEQQCDRHFDRILPIAARLWLAAGQPAVLPPGRPGGPKFQIQFVAEPHRGTRSGYAGNVNGLPWPARRDIAGTCLTAQSPWAKGNATNENGPWIRATPSREGASFGDSRR